MESDSNTSNPQSIQNSTLSSEETPQVLSDEETPSQTGIPPEISLAIQEMLAKPHKARRLLVKYKPVMKTKALKKMASSGAKVIRDYHYILWKSIEVPTDLASMMSELSKDPSIVSVQPDYVVYAIGSPTDHPFDYPTIAAVPNDPMFGELWGMHNTGQSGGLVDADIDAPEAWNITTEDSSVIVADIDTGVDYNHPDLADNIWTNPGEIPGDGIDNDDNGYIDDVHGYDFNNNDGDPTDDHGHGTHTSGTIAAVGNNSVGVTGVAWHAQIMALKFLSASASGYTSDAISAIEYSINKLI